MAMKIFPHITCDCITITSPQTSITNSLTVRAECTNLEQIDPASCQKTPKIQITFSDAIFHPATRRWDVAGTSQMKHPTRSRWNVAKTSQWYVSMMSYWNVVTSQEEVTTSSHQYVSTASQTSLKWNTPLPLSGTSPRRLSGTYPRRLISTLLCLL